MPANRPVRIEVRLTPRASRDRIAVDGERVAAWVTAPPVDGKANIALIGLMAKSLGVPKSSVAVIAGGASRNKVIEISGMSREKALTILGQ